MCPFVTTKADAQSTLAATDIEHLQVVLVEANINKKKYLKYFHPV